jgi:RHS repeat-associated protein
MNDNAASQFLKTDKGKTKSNSIEVPSLSLPKGGGAIKGVDEKFSVNAVNGTASFSIPLPFSPARGASPSLSLSYNSGSGNGIFGLGWNFGLASIKRKTDKGLPQYLDAIESDTFLFSEVEDLVPQFKKEDDRSFTRDTNGNYAINEKDSPDGLCKIRFYSPRIEGLFARIERWTEKTTGIIKWRIITRDNHTTLFGWSSGAVIIDPNDNKKIFEWLPELAFDDKGNCCQYIYKRENDIGFDVSVLHNKNRFKSESITYTNLYLEKILYGNKTPYKEFEDAYPMETDYMFQTVFDYGEYDLRSPYEKIREWDFRMDPFSDYKAGFEIRTTRLCKRVLLFHFFPELPGGYALIKSTDFEYNTTSNEGFTFLKSITACGYIKKSDGTYTSKKLPATEFEYQVHEWDKEVKVISQENLVHAPSGLDDQHCQFVDLFNEGLSGILTEQGDGWYYKHNLGDGKFEQAQVVTPKPSFVGLGSQLQLVDLNADGGKQLVSYGADLKGYFELDDDNEWQPFRAFQNLPNIDFGDSNARMLDLNGDGKPEVLITEDNVFTWYQSDGRNGYSQINKTIQSFDEEKGPHVVFANPDQTIFLADMSGDGMTDIVRIRNGEVCYWPNLGYGKFGAKVAMDNAPVFDYPDSFNSAFLRLADIDGSGTPDIIYLGKNKFTCWMNLSGNSFSTTPFEIDAFPDVHSHAKITVTDLLGNGVSCIVWSSGLRKDIGAPLRYIDLMNSKKPHIMVSYKNNLGKEVSMEYTPSTKFYIEDKLSGKPWVTKLHFPIHCISKTETRDKISGHRFVSSYKYHHGYYDHPEREFRGFGMVEQIDAEHFEHWVKGDATNIADATLNQQPVVSKTWTHTGAFLSREKILNQFAHEYWYEEMNRQGFEVTNNEVPLPDARIVPAPGMSNTIVDHLSSEEWCEALRACKSMTLRSEVFAHDAPATRKQLTPFSVATQNCVIELLQPKGKNKHAIFVVKESEAVTYNYERNTEDPRISHTLNIKLDEFGNVLESASVVYPRVLTDSSLPAETQQAQSKTVIIYSQHQFTNDVLGNNVYRLRLPSEVKTFELKSVAKAGPFYAVHDFENILSTASEVAYPDFEGSPRLGGLQKRLIEHVCSKYYRNDFSAALPLHHLESLAIPFEHYQLAYTPELITDIYGLKVSGELLTEGKFTNLDRDSNWWIRSGTTQFKEGGETERDAQNRFYVPVSYTDPYGSKTKVKYYRDYFLFIEETEDEMKNKSRVDLFNFRTLSPQRMRDINNNLSEAISDELGLVKAMAVSGKGDEADDLADLEEHTTDIEQNAIESFFTTRPSTDLVNQGKSLLHHATARFIYDFDIYKRSGKPAVVASVVREEHFQRDSNSPVQLSFEYSNGLGKVIMKKVPAEPGLAKQVIVKEDGTIHVTEIDTAASTPRQLRWIGNGRTILNNKGNAVKQYEPYFSVTHYYEDFKELVETGVTPIMYYDAMGRAIKTEMPDGTFSKVEFDSWKQSVYDANDTVLESTWYHNRINRLIDDELIAAFKDPVREEIAGNKAAFHARTPNVLHFDTLGRPVLSIDHNKNITTAADEFYRTKVLLDVKGNLRSVTDARELPENSNKGNTVMQYKYDMLGNLVYHNSIDAGQRWLLINILGKPLRTWDERDHEFQYFYDTLHRPTHSVVKFGDGATRLNNIFDRIIYGESLLAVGRSNEADLQAVNILGKPVKHFDTGGVVLTPEYDFKGQPIFTTRRLFKYYKDVVNWIDTHLVDDLEDDSFTFTTQTDALGRITRQIAPDGSIITPRYNEAGLLNGETVLHIGSASATTYIKDIDYNEKGQRNKIIYGNDVTTKFYYDRETFRLKRLEAKRQDNDPLQDWYYTFDPAGNITHIEDKNIPVVFFNNDKIAGVSEYTYDALYRLAVATGRENNAALTFDNKDNWNDAPFMHRLNPGDPMAVRNYTQRYQYDEVGNINQMRHQSAGNNWTRNYDYEKTNNRLRTTQIGAEIYTYTHHLQHGFIMVMPHLDDMGWNFKEELVKTIKQRVSPGTGTAETTYYQYDGQGQRIRKITENSAPAGATPTKKEERIYISGYETYRTYQANFIDFERESLSLIDQGNRFVMVETVKQNTSSTFSPSERVGARLTRYKVPNHLGSASLELDATAQVISYEEYHPYGTTAYKASNATINATAKRYRYTGMERDEETGLEYHSARYYLPWLGRWVSADPLGLIDGCNCYQYVRNNPINYTDLNGKITKRDRRIVRLVMRLFEFNEVVNATGNPQTAISNPAISPNPNPPPGDVGSYPSGIEPTTGTSAHSASDSTEQMLADAARRAQHPEVSWTPEPVGRGSGLGINATSEVGPVTATGNVSGSQTGPVRSSLPVEPQSGMILTRETPVEVERRVRTEIRTELRSRLRFPLRNGWSRHIDLPHPTVGTSAVPHTPHAPRTLRGRGLILTAIVAGGVFLFTGSAYAAVQSANPAAGTTDALLRSRGAGDVARGVVSDLWYLTPPGVVHGAGMLIWDLNQAAMDASHFPTREGWTEQMVREGRNPFCAICHDSRGPGNSQAREGPNISSGFEGVGLSNNPRALETYIRSLNR